MSEHDNVHQILLTESELPKRLDEALQHPRYHAAMELAPEPLSSASIVIATIGLGAAAVFPWVGVAVAPDPPLWLFLMMGALSLIPALILRSAWRRWWSMTRGFIHRELYAVLDCSDVPFDNVSRYYLTLWNREKRVVRVEHPIGVPHIRAGDVGVAVFRDDQLVNIIRIPSI